MTADAGATTSGEVSLRDSAALWATRFAETMRGVDVDPDDIDPDAAAALPLAAARRARAVALRYASTGELIVAVADPSSLDTIDEVRAALPAGVRPEFRAGDPGRIDRCLRLLAQAHATAAQAGSLADLDPDPAAGPQAEDEAASGPVVRLVDGILAAAAARGASDIHLESGPDDLAVRLRVDSVMREHSRVPGRAAAAVVRRVKIMSRMDIADRLRFHDGRFETIVDGRRYDARVTALPTSYGEDVVIRLFDTDRSARRLDELGLGADVVGALVRAVSSPHGLVVICGPTGSGKTTTNYACLSSVVTSDKKVLAVEDPVEIRMPGITQVQVNEAAGVGFASSLRSFLRSDPDIILVGEVRDAETARLAVQAAQTGHLVLTTLHTNSAAAGPSRLADLGADPWLLADTLRAVLSQRLLRRLCPDCSRPDSAADHTLATLAAARVPGPPPEPGRLRMAGPGCASCEGSGYRGMVCVGELVEVDPLMARMIAGRASAAEVASHAEAMGMVTMAAHAARLVADGTTDLRETRRVGL